MRSKETNGESHLRSMQEQIPQAPTVRVPGTAGELERLYATGFHRYLRVAEAITENPESALDAVQEAFASALQHHSKFRGDARLSTWVWRLIVNAARKASRRTELALTPEIADRRVQPEAASRELEPLIMALPERQRLTLFLRYYADLDYHAIADVLGVRLGTVGATLNKAHAAIRMRLEEVPDDSR
jgi:RNA polymerase sigma-70 factor (ECF subfamily)